MTKPIKEPVTEVFFKDLPEVEIEVTDVSYGGTKLKLRVKAESVDKAKRVAKEVFEWLPKKLKK